MFEFNENKQNSPTSKRERKSGDSAKEHFGRTCDRIQSVLYYWGQVRQNI